MADASPAAPAVPLVTRRKVLEAGAVGLAVLVVPGCGGAGGSGATSGTSSGTTSGTSGTGTSGSGTSGSGTGTTGSSATSGSTTGAQCTPKRVCTNDANTLVIHLPDHPELLTVGKPELFNDSRFADPNCTTSVGSFYVTQTSSDVFEAVSVSCTHACCDIAPESGIFLCPCHGSQFDFSGNVLQGPAASNLTTLSTCLDGCGNLLIEL